MHSLAIHGIMLQQQGSADAGSHPCGACCCRAEQHFRGRAMAVATSAASSTSVVASIGSYAYGAATYQAQNVLYAVNTVIKTTGSGVAAAATVLSSAAGKLSGAESAGDASGAGASADAAGDAAEAAAGDAAGEAAKAAASEADTPGTDPTTTAETTTVTTEAAAATATAAGPDGTAVVAAVAATTTVETVQEKLVAVKPFAADAEAAPAAGDSGGSAQQAPPDPDEYVQLVGKQMVGLYVSVWVRRRMLQFIRGVQATSVATGFGGYLGNKGAVAVRMRVLDSSLCLVCCHMAAGERRACGAALRHAACSLQRCCRSSCMPGCAQHDLTCPEVQSNL